MHAPGTQLVTVHGLQKICQNLRREIGLRDQAPRILGDQELRIHRLMIVNGRRKRHKQCSGTNGGQLRHGAGARTADHQIGLRKRLRGVIDEGRQFGLHASRLVIGAQRVNLFGATLMGHHRPLLGG